MHLGSHSRCDSVLLGDILRLDGRVRVSSLKCLQWSVDKNNDEFRKAFFQIASASEVYFPNSYLLALCNALYFFRCYPVVNARILLKILEKFFVFYFLFEFLAVMK